MALASLDDPDEVARRRRLNEEGRGALEQALRDGGFEVAGPAVANFVYADVGGDARPLFEALLRLGVIVRPLARLRRARGDPRQRGHARGDGDLRRGPRARASRGGVIRTGLLGRAPAFRLLFLATLGSGIGTMLAVIALTVDVYERTGSGAWVSAVLVADFVPTIAIGLLLGPLVDRLSRRWLMVGADLVRLAAFVALPFAPECGAIVALALVVGFANGFFRPAAYAGMPNLVDRADLARANSLFQATDNLTWLLGPLLGGVLLARVRPGRPVPRERRHLRALRRARAADPRPAARVGGAALPRALARPRRGVRRRLPLAGAPDRARRLDDRDGRERGGERGGGLPRAGVVRRRQPRARDPHGHGRRGARGRQPPRRADPRAGARRPPVRRLDRDDGGRLRARGRVARASGSRCRASSSPGSGTAPPASATRCSSRPGRRTGCAAAPSRS